MRRSLPYEVLATVMALVGVFTLIKAYVPLLNPGMYRIKTGRTGEPLSYYLLWTPIAILILGFSWYLNVKAQRLKREEIESNNKPPA
jgi:hypothetical protein